MTKPVPNATFFYIDSTQVPSSALISTTEVEEDTSQTKELGPQKAGQRFYVTQQNCKFDTQRWADGVSARVDRLRAKKNQSCAIRREIKQCKQELNISEELLRVRCASYEQQKIADDEKSRAIAAKIRSTKINTTAITPSTTRKTSLLAPLPDLNEAKAGMDIVADILSRAGSAAAYAFKAVRDIDPAKEREQIRQWTVAPPNDPIDELKEAAAGLHVVAETIRLTKKAGEDAVKAVCSIDPDRKKTCKSALKFGEEAIKATLETTGLKEPVKEAIRYVKSCDGSSLVGVLEKNGIPEQEAKQMAKQFVEDSLTIGAAAGLGTAGFVAKKGIGALARKMAKGEAAGEAASARAPKRGSVVAEAFENTTQIKNLPPRPPSTGGNWRKWNAVISHEKELVSALKKKLPVLQTSKDFPKASYQILRSEYLHHPVNTPVIRGTLLLKRIGEDKLLYIHRDTFHGKVLITAALVSNAKTIQHVYKALVGYAKKNNISDINIAFNHTAHPVASALEDISVPMTRIGTLPTASVSAPLTVIEIPVERALGVLQQTAATAKKALSSATKNVKTAIFLACAPLHEAQPIVNGIFKVVHEQPAGISVARAIDKAPKRIKALVPDVSHLGPGSQNIWCAALEKGSKDAVKPKITHFKSEKSMKVAKIGDSIIIKDSTRLENIICEAVACDFLSPLKLSNLQTPSLVTLGQYLSGNGEARYFIAKTYVPGNTITSNIKKVGELSVLSPERHSLYENLRKAFLQAGKAFGELHSKGIMQERAELIPQLIQREIEWFDEVLRQTNTQLKGLPKIKMEHSQRRFLVEGFARAPGEISYGFGNDIGMRQFTWHEATSTFGFVDLERAANCFNINKQPLAFSAGEAASFTTELNLEGFIHRLIPKEMGGLHKAFNKGHRSEFVGMTTPESELFYKIYSSIYNIRELCRYKYDPKFIIPLVEEVNREIIIFLKPAAGPWGVIH